MVVLGGVKGRGKVRQICCIEKCVFCSSPKNFLLFSLTLLFILKQNPRIRGPGEHYTVQKIRHSTVLYISENVRKKVFFRFVNVATELLIPLE